MNEGSGQTVRDWSGRGNHGYLGSTPAADANDPAWIRGVFLGSALRFDGVDDQVTIPASDTLKPQRLTVAAWIRGGASPGQYKYIVDQGAINCDTGSYGLYTGSTGGVSFYVASGQYTYHRSPEAPATVWDGKWHHVAGTFDGSKVRVFVDGVQIGSGTDAPVQIDYSFPLGGGEIGNYPGEGCYSSLTLTGDIDGVQVWSQALPVDTIWRTLKALFSLAK
jgi:hypothetical protein